MTFVDKVGRERKAVPAKFKTPAADGADWVPTVFGRMSIDCVERKGFGMVPCKSSFYVAAMPRGQPTAESTPRDRGLRSQVSTPTVRRAKAGSETWPSWRSRTWSRLQARQCVGPDYLVRLESNDGVEFDEVLLDTVGVVIPSGRGAWVPAK